VRIIQQIIAVPISPFFHLNYRARSEKRQPNHADSGGKRTNIQTNGRNEAECGYRWIKRRNKQKQIAFFPNERNRTRENEENVFTKCNTMHGIELLLIFDRKQSPSPQGVNCAFERKRRTYFRSPDFMRVFAMLAFDPAKNQLQ